MTRMSAAQYNLLSAALGEALADQRRESAEAGAVVMIVAGSLARHLRADNRNFDEALFQERIQAVADVYDQVEEAHIDA